MAKATDGILEEMRGALRRASPIAGHSVDLEALEPFAREVLIGRRLEQLARSEAERESVLCRAEMAKNGTLHVTVDLRSTDVVERVQVWDAETGGDAVYLPEHLVEEP